MPDSDSKCPQCSTGELFTLGVYSNAKSKTMVMVHCRRCTYGTVRTQAVKPRANFGDGSL